MDPTAAIRAAAEAGEALAQFELAECLLRGEVAPLDEAQAVRWLRLAAAQGHQRAQHSLAECLEAGRGVALDRFEAARWFSLAAGDPAGAGVAPTRPTGAPDELDRPAALEADEHATVSAARATRARALGALCIVCSAAGFATSAFIIRRANDVGFAPSAISLHFGLVRALLCGLAVLARGRAGVRVAFCVGGGRRLVALVCARQAAGATSVLCVFAAYPRMPIGDVTALVYTAPVWTSALAALCLREPLTSVGVASALAAVVGVALVARASVAETDGGGGGGGGGLVGSALSLSAALLLAGMVVATRAIGTRMDSVALTFWLGVSMSAVSALLVGATGDALAPARARAADWAALLVAALVSLVANVLLNLGLQRIEAGPGNVIASLEVLFAYAYQLVLLRTPSSPAALAGTAVIVASALGATLTGCACASAARVKRVGSRPFVALNNY